MRLNARIAWTALLALGLGLLLLRSPSPRQLGLLPPSFRPSKIRCSAHGLSRVFLRGDRGWQPEEGFQRVEKPTKEEPHYRDVGLPKDQIRRMRYFVARSLGLIEDLLITTAPTADLADLAEVPNGSGLKPPRARLEIWEASSKRPWTLELGADSATRDGVYYHALDTGRIGVLHRIMRDLVVKMAEGRFDPRPGA